MKKNDFQKEIEKIVLFKKKKPLFGNLRSDFSNRANRRKFNVNVQTFSFGSKKYHIPVRTSRSILTKIRKRIKYEKSL